MSNSTSFLMFGVRKSWVWIGLRVLVNHEIKYWGPLFNFNV